MLYQCLSGSHAIAARVAAKAWNLAIPGGPKVTIVQGGCPANPRLGDGVSEIYLGCNMSEDGQAATGDYRSLMADVGIAEEDIQIDCDVKNLGDLTDLYMHEIGHAYGLSHPGMTAKCQDSIMVIYTCSGVTGPTARDVAAVVSHRDSLRVEVKGKIKACIADQEFFYSVDQWIAGSLSNIEFFATVDVWIAGC